MTVISETINRKKQKEVVGEGIVKFIKLEKFQELKVSNIKVNGVDKRIESTHKASVLLENDGDLVWISLGEFKSNKDNITFKVGDEWKELKQGQTVIIDIKKVGEWNGKPTYQSSKSNITILEEVPEGYQAQANNSSGNANSASSTKASNPTGSAQQKQSGANSGQLFKVYGEIKSISDGIAVVDNEGKPTQVVLGDYAAQVSVGGRMTARLDAQGNIKEGFKAYEAKKPVNEAKKISKVSDDAFNSKERQFKMSFGNVVNVSSFAVGPKDVEKVFKFAQELFNPVAELREKLIAKYANERSDNDVGSKLGDALKHAAVAVGKADINKILEQAESWVHAHIAAENAMMNPVANEQPSQPVKQQPAKQEKKEEVPPPSFLEEDSDFSDPDIPDFDDDQDELPF